MNISSRLYNNSEEPVSELLIKVEMLPRYHMHSTLHGGFNYPTICYLQKVNQVSFVFSVVEAVGYSWRVRMGISFQFGFSLGFIMVPWIAYYVRGYEMLQLVLAGPLLVFIIFFWYVIFLYITHNSL